VSTGKVRAQERRAAMQQVSDWLEQLGLGQGLRRQRHQPCRPADLAYQHLKKIGVCLGHRLQLLRAITELTSRKEDDSKAVVAYFGSEAIYLRRRRRARR
jgi:hypothetical protein